MDLRLMDKFKEKSILVIGDLMIDKYIYGQATRISPEAPVPVICVSREENVLGGAGNVASNLAMLGAKVSVAGIAGDDKEANILKKLFENKKIDVSLIFEDSSRPTTIKKRVISGNNYQLIRLDYEAVSDISNEIEKKLISEIIKRFKQFDAIIISDYSKGMITERLVKEIIHEASKSKKMTIIDGKPCHIDFFKGCTLIKPNLKEASEMTGIKDDILAMGKMLVSRLECNVLITRGSEGISVFEKNGKCTHVEPLTVTRVFDVTGAGDTVLAVSALALCSGFDYVKAATLANFAAGIKVQKPGTYAVSIEELKEYVAKETSYRIKETMKI